MKSRTWVGLPIESRNEELKMKNRFCLLLLTMSFLILSCTATYKTQSNLSLGALAGKNPVALLPLVNLTSYPNAGRIVGDILATELYARSEIQLLERTEMLEKLQGGSRDIEAVVDNASAVKLAQKLGAQTVVFGSVSEFRYKRGLDEEPAVGINLRLLDVEQNRVLWAGSISATSNCFFMCRDSLNYLTQQKCAELIDGMVGEMKKGKR